jgi:hypothetical protein
MENPMSILSCTLNEFGHPQISGGNVMMLIERLTHHKFIGE